MAHRPGLVTVIAVIVYINAVLTIVSGLFTVFAGSDASRPASWGDRLSATGVVAIVLGAITLFVAQGLFRGSPVARGIVAIVEVLNVINGVLTIVHGQLAAGIGASILPVVVLAVLYSRRANAFFRR